MNYELFPKIENKLTRRSLSVACKGRFPIKSWWLSLYWTRFRLRSWFSGPALPATALPSSLKLVRDGPSVRSPRLLPRMGTTRVIPRVIRGGCGVSSGRALTPDDGALNPGVFLLTTLPVAPLGKPEPILSDFSKFAYVFGSLAAKLTHDYRL